MATVLPVLLRFITATALLLGLISAAFAVDARAPDAATAAATTAARAALKAAPAPGTSGSGFVANNGQWPSQVLYMAPIKGGRAWVTASGIVYDFTKAAKPKRGNPGERGVQPPGLKDGLKDGPKAAKARQAERVQGHVVRLNFAGAALPAVRPKGKLKTRLNYFLGNDASKQAKNVPAYATVSLEGLWPGVDLRLAQEPGGLGLSFNAADAAALAKARVFVDGASLLEGRGEGALVSTSLGQRSLGSVAVSLGSTRHAGQLGAGAVALAPNRPVTRAQAVAASESGGGLVYSTFLGGSENDDGYGLAVDASGAAYITGGTDSSDFPTTPGAYDTTYNVSGRAFVAKLSADGSTLAYATYLNAGAGTGIAVDASGAAYVTGLWASWDFPTTPGAYDTTCNSSGADAYVTKLSADGSALVYSTCLGGNGDDQGYALAVDVGGAAYVTGRTQSSNFPTTLGAFDTTYNGGYGDVFVTKLSPSGSALIYSTFLGGSESNGDWVNALAVDASGVAYITGETHSSDFPTTPGAFDATYNGSNDAYATKLSSNGSALIYSTFLGGSDSDFGEGLAVDASGAAYVSGWTYSSDFPTTPGAYDTTNNGGYDAYVTKLSADGSALIYSTFLGGENGDYSYALAVNASGAAYVTGATDSYEFPTTPGAFDTTQNGGLYNPDAFVTKLSTDGSALVYSTFLGGGNGYDEGHALAVDASGAAYITGTTGTLDFPTTPGAYDTTCDYHSYCSDTFVTKLDIGSGVIADIDLIATATPTTVAAGSSFTVNYTVNNHTDDPVTGDLFFTASSNGSRVGRGQVLTDNPVAAHGSITGSFTQLVPSNAAPGVYTYTLRAGQAPNKTKDKVKFTITVTGAARASGGASAWQVARHH